MTAAPPQSFQIFAPAKINPFLHITGKRSDGLHSLDSLITFADIGDVISISPMDGFSFDINGPMAGSFDEADKSARPDSKNLVVRAVWALARMTNRTPSFSITLGKNLPLGAGIGGGSADAAAALWGLCRYWKIAHDQSMLMDLLMKLGADVPVCFESQTRFVAGAGENLSAPVRIPETHAVLIYPNIHCSTKGIFEHYRSSFNVPAERPAGFKDQDSFIAYLKKTQNELMPAAVRAAPDIRNALMQLEGSDGCRMARMSGSGSTCFGLYDTQEQAEKARETIKETNPDWWVRSTVLGRTERY